MLWLLARATNARLLDLLPVPFYVVLFLPGTLVHEMSHLIVAKALFVPVGKLSLWPKRRESEIVLGSVAIARTSFLKRFLIGVAPVVFGLVIILLFSYLTLERDFVKDRWVFVIAGYVVFVVANTMFSSKKDMEGAWKTGIFLLAAAIVFFLLRIKITLDENLFRVASIYLLPAIAIDAVVVIVLSLRKRR